MDDRNKRKKRSFKDLNKQYDFLDKGIDALKTRQSEGQTGREDSGRTARRANPRVTPPYSASQETGRPRRPSKRRMQVEDYDINETIRMSPEMVERERQRLDRIKKLEERKKRENTRRVILAVGIVVLLILIFVVVRKIRGANAPEKPNTQMNVDTQQNQNTNPNTNTNGNDVASNQSTTPVPQMVDSSGQLQKFLRTNKRTAMYKEANLNSQEIKMIERDQYVESYGVNAEFVKVKIGGELGYIKAIDLTNIEDENMFKVINGTLIVDQKYYLPSDYNPGVQEDAKKAYDIMANAAKQDKITLKLSSDFRSFDQQKTLYEKEVAEKGAESAKQFVESPGHSEAQAGLLFEIMGENYDQRLSESFDNSPEARWLNDNAYKYGFILRYPQGKEQITGMRYKSWVWRYVGVEKATAMHQQNVTLEEFLGLSNNGQNNMPVNQNNNGNSQNQNGQNQNGQNQNINSNQNNTNPNANQNQNQNQNGNNNANGQNNHDNSGQQNNTNSNNNNNSNNNTQN